MNVARVRIDNAVGEESLCIMSSSNHVLLPSCRAATTFVYLYILIEEEQILPGESGNV
jgi:hypothetical protein